MTEKYKELVNTILTQFADNKEMTYSILGKSIVKMAVEIKIEELETVKALLIKYNVSHDGTDGLIELYKNINLK
jgi:hypothetical protein